MNVLKLEDVRFQNHILLRWEIVKFTFSEKATKIDKIFTANLTVCSNCQIDGEDFINFCGLLRKHELYFDLPLFDEFFLLRKIQLAVF